MGNINKKEVLVAIVVIALAVTGFYMIKGDSSNTLSAIALNDDGTLKGEFALQEIIALGKPLKCDFEKSSGDATVLGSMLISSGDVRGDLKINGSPVGTIESHFITKDNFSYTWTSLANVGYKKAVTKTTEETASPSEQASIVGVNDKIEYSCSPWTPDPTLFSLPTNITFQNLK